LISDSFLEGSLLNDIFSLELPFLTHSHLDLVTLNSQLEYLSLEINTLSLWIETELAKRQKMRASFKQLKREISTPCSEVAPLRQEVSMIHKNINTTSYHLEGEINRLTTNSFSILLKDASNPCLFHPSYLHASQRLYWSGPTAERVHKNFTTILCPL